MVSESWGCGGGGLCDHCSSSPSGEKLAHVITVRIHLVRELITVSRGKVWSKEVLNQGESSARKDRRRPAVTGSWRGLEEGEAMLVGLFW